MELTSLAALTEISAQRIKPNPIQDTGQSPYPKSGVLSVCSDFINFEHFPVMLYCNTLAYCQKLLPLDPIEPV